MTVRDGGGGGLVDDAKDGEPCDDTGVLGGLTLSVVDVGGDGDDDVGDFLTEGGFGVLLYLSGHHGGDILGGPYIHIQYSCCVISGVTEPLTGSFFSPLCSTSMMGRSFLLPTPE